MSGSASDVKEAAARARLVERWPWCTCPPDPNQLQLFQAPAKVVELEWTWPVVETSWSSRVGFWRRRTPAVFGSRRGVGPLIVCPDTNVLITIYESLEALEEGFALVQPMPPPSGWSTAVEALRDLVALWWWRDVRFWVDAVVHLADARKPVRPERMRAREIAVRQLGRDFFERGGFESRFPTGVEPVDPVCVVHSDREQALIGAAEAVRWPSGGLDRRLAKAALDAGCHVLLTEDRDMLKSHASLWRTGMAVMTPGEFMVELRDSGELEPVRSPDDPAPDLSTLARFYSLRAPEAN